MKWTEEEIQYLKDNYSDNTNEYLSNKLDRSKFSVVSKAGSLKLYKSNKHQFFKVQWTKSEKEYLDNNYHHKPNKEIAKYLNKTLSSILSQANIRHLYKLHYYNSKLFWSEIDIEYLTNNYQEMSNKYLSKELDKSVGAIQCKSLSLGLIKKYNTHLSNVELKNIASKYKTRKELQMNDANIYTISLYRKILDDVCSHMIPQSYSTPQLICKFIFDILVGEECQYNTRRIIKPYELDLYYPNYKLAIEYNGKHWHSESDNTEFKILLCKKLAIELIVIEENSINYEKDIKRDIIKLLPMLNKILGKNIKDNHILNINITSNIFDNLIDEDNIIEIINKYDNYTSFRKNENPLYRKLIRLKLLDKYTKHLSRLIKRRN